MSDGGEEREESQGGPRVEFTKALPLSSRRLTATQLRDLAAAFHLPTTASTEDIRLMTEGCLQEKGQNPLNVQVCLDDPLPVEGRRG